ncbi:Uma2 family endonuclease [Phototrophicus methaneseepsis]|uniref:Uma2 family endonuclease n=1 Tax=Phototrophicus methaneseepsis TaxID=2710758 RepID=A0A7S8EB66_9CHLR|nr:Uma2 family endonuclease [Phototrophicus methaneseepsis]QPC83752.1 Uma2 family endonuclease [Phototrophicus methaneseepsis]
MVALPDHQNMTPEEYLEFERQSDEKHEYIGGQIYAMAGAKRRHVWITTRIATLLSIQAQVGPCDVLSSDMRVQISHDAYFYPDVVVACDDYQYSEGEGDDNLTRPSVIVEVLSPTTQDYDRGRKWQQYRRIASLQDYLLVSQGMMLVEHYTRTSETSWQFQEYTKPEDVVSLVSIGCELKLDDIYQKIDFSVDE